MAFSLPLLGQQRQSGNWVTTDVWTASLT